MHDPALPYTPTELEVLGLVDHLTTLMQAQERAGLPDPERGAKILELQRMADSVIGRARHRQQEQLAEAAEDAEDEAGPVEMPKSKEGKLKLLKRLELLLTTVQADGSTLAEKVADRKGVETALRRSAELYAQLKPELDQQRKREEAAEEKLRNVRDMLLLWKLNSSMLHGPGGQA